MCSALILSRLNALNCQLKTITKLQGMENESNINIRSKRRKIVSDVLNNSQKPCRCSHHVVPLKENDKNSEERVSSNTNKRRIVCNVDTCVVRKGVCFCRNRIESSAQVGSKNVDSASNESIAKIGKEDKSDQTSLDSRPSKNYFIDKEINTHEEKENDSSTRELNDQSRSNDEKAEEENVIQDVQDNSVTNSRIYERVQKDLLNERKRTKELEEKLAATSKDLAADEADQAKVEADVIQADRDKLLNDVANLQKQIAEIARKNETLVLERDDFKSKLDALSRSEAKKCEEVEEEVNKIKRAVKEKEVALCNERKEFAAIISELTSVIKIQKKKTSELTSVCGSQQRVLQSSNKKSKELENKVGHLERCLSEETKTCECLKQEVGDLKDNHYSELRIKEKIIDEQNRTIARQKKLLHDSQEMVQQVASEFDQIRDELYREKQRGNSLELALKEADAQLNTAHLSECGKCKVLRNEIEFLSEEKQRAVTATKFAIQKLYNSAKEYQQELLEEKRRHRFTALVLQRKEQEMGYLRREINYNSARSIDRIDHFIM